MKKAADEAHAADGFQLADRLQSRQQRRLHVTPLPEDDVIQVKGVLDDAGGGYSDPQNILLGGHIPWGSYSF